MPQMGSEIKYRPTPTEDSNKDADLHKVVVGNSEPRNNKNGLGDAKHLTVLYKGETESSCLGQKWRPRELYLAALCVLLFVACVVIIIVLLTHSSGKCSFLLHPLNP